MGSSRFTISLRRAPGRLAAAARAKQRWSELLARGQAQASAVAVSREAEGATGNAPAVFTVVPSVTVSTKLGRAVVAQCKDASRRAIPRDGRISKCALQYAQSVQWEEAMGRGGGGSVGRRCRVVRARRCPSSDLTGPSAASSFPTRQFWAWSHVTARAAVEVSRASQASANDDHGIHSPHDKYAKASGLPIPAGVESAHSQPWPTLAHYCDSNELLESRRRRHKSSQQLPQQCQSRGKERPQTMTRRTRRDRAQRRPPECQQASSTLAHSQKSLRLMKRSTHCQKHRQPKCHCPSLRHSIPPPRQSLTPS